MRAWKREKKRREEKRREEKRGELGGVNEEELGEGGAWSRSLENFRLQELKR